MDQPAQTLGYMVAGYVVIFSALFGYIISLALRWKKARTMNVLLEKRDE
jgi:CcmD family protein